MNDLEVLNQMAIQNEEIFMFPLENIIELSDLNKARSEMKMLIDGGVANKLVKGGYVGAFIVADKEQFYKIKKMEKD